MKIHPRLLSLLVLEALDVVSVLLVLLVLLERRVLVAAMISSGLGIACCSVRADGRTYWWAIKRPRGLGGW